MYSLMSTRISASRSANRNSASARASSVFPTPVGPGKMKRADRPLRILEAGAAAADRPADRLDRLVLADDPLVQLVLHVHQPLGLRLAQTRDRDARPAAHDEADVLLGDLRAVVLALLLPLFLLAPDLRAAARAPESRSSAARSKSWSRIACFLLLGDLLELRP